MMKVLPPFALQAAGPSRAWDDHGGPVSSWRRENTVKFRK